MPRKRFSAEQIVVLLRQIEVLVSQGKTPAVACSRSRHFAAELRDECLSQEIFFSLKEAQVVVELWSTQYNTTSPHSSLGYRPPAPLTSTGLQTNLDQHPPIQ